MARFNVGVPSAWNKQLKNNGRLVCAMPRDDKPSIEDPDPHILRLMVKKSDEEWQQYDIINVLFEELE